MSLFPLLSDLYRVTRKKRKNIYESFGMSRKFDYVTSYDGFFTDRVHVSVHYRNSYENEYMTCDITTRCFILINIRIRLDMINHEKLIVSELHFDSASTHQVFESHDGYMNTWIDKYLKRKIIEVLDSYRNSWLFNESRNFTFEDCEMAVRHAIMRKL